MQTVTTIGLDIAKSVFQVHGVDAEGNVLIRRQLKRRYVLAFFEKLPPCLVGIEACATSHHWSRELKARGHNVRLMPPAYVKPYVKRQKNDAADAEAICEAVTRANMRFVETKTPEQQSCLMLHRTRQLFIRQQTSVINAIRAHMAEFGIVAPVGRKGVEQLLDVVADARDRRVPEVARACIAALGAQLRLLKAQILEFDRRILAWHRSNETSRRLDELPGVGPALATALVASVADAKAFKPTMASASLFNPSLVRICCMFLVPSGEAPDGGSRGFSGSTGEPVTGGTVTNSYLGTVLSLSSVGRRFRPAPQFALLSVVRVFGTAGWFI